MNWKKAAAAMGMAAMVLAGCAPAASQNPEGKPKVVTSFYVMQDFVQKIGGEHVAVQNLVPDGVEAHHWEPKASDLIALERADVFVYNGLGLEHWVDSALGALENKALTVVDTGKLVTAIAAEGSAGDEGHDHEHEDNEDHDHEDDADHDHDHEHEDEADHDHDHGDWDPHAWLSPLQAKQQMKAIRDGLIQADPDNRAAYEANYETYAEKCDELDREMREALEGFEKRDIVVTHRAFGYLCNAYGLNQVAIMGLSAEAEPSAARMAEIIRLVEDKGISTIFFEDLINPAVAQAIATQTGARTAVLTPIEGLTAQQRADGADYFSLMRQNLQALKEALA